MPLWAIPLYPGLATCDRGSLKVILALANWRLCRRYWGQALRRCRRSARRFAPLLALASAGDPRRPRPGSAALGGGWLALWRHEERPPYRGPCVRLGGQHHLLLSSLFHLRFLLRITQHNRIRRNILANRLVTTVQPLPQGHI